MDFQKKHKEGCPTRPILDMMNVPQYQVAKFLIPVSKQISIYCIKYSFSSVDNLRNESVLPDKMWSFDIKSLFTNVPLKKTISIGLEKLYNSDFIPPLIPKHVCRSLLSMFVKNV